MKLRFLFLLILHLPVFQSGCWADVVPDKRFTVSGVIKDKSNGEDLTGAAIYVTEIRSGATTNSYGFYSLSLVPGNYTLIFSFIGFETVEKRVQLSENVVINLELVPQGKEIQEITIKGESAQKRLSKTEMSVEKLQIQTIRSIPAFMGEVDIIKAIQLLPGVKTTTEGTSGFSVRGGSADQNLVLLDEATVYNVSHLMGFFSVFNNDAIKELQLYKGDIPASSGGRLASLLDVRMKDGNLKKIEGSGGIGTISSRLTLEGPILKDQTSFILSGRRTYADLFLPFASDPQVRKNKLFFYDFNAKINHRIDENNRLYLSGYFGEDVFKSNFFFMGFGNRTFTGRWNHLFSQKVFANFSVNYSKYNYNLGAPEGDANSFIWTSAMEDVSLKSDFGYFINPSNTLKFGLSMTRHFFQPGKAKGLGDQSFISDFILPDSHALQSGIYVSNEQSISPVLNVKYGLRLSIFQNIGQMDYYVYDQSNPEEYLVSDTLHYKTNEIAQTYSGLEPRIGLTYLVTENSSVKASYSRTRQYLQLASNSTGGTPLDVWFSASPNVKPQIADQWAIGYFRNFLSNQLEGSVECYYKSMQNTIDFRDHAQLLLNTKMEGELRIGTSQAYGAEFQIKKPEGRLNGWISYTYSRTERKIPEINKGKSYLAPYDKPHDIAIVLNYEAGKRTSISATWVYSTGNPVTFPTGRWEYGNVVVPSYSERNTYRMPDYHRLDLSLTLKGKEKPNQKWEGEWNFSIYNAYGHKNAWAINFRQDDLNPDETFAEMTYLFSFVPSVTYNFKF